MSGVKKRAYRSPLRAEQAAASRSAVLASARELFVRQGYGATTVEQIAAGAGVSKPTVFTAVGNKAEVLRAVRDVTMAGDEEKRSVTQRSSVSAIASASGLDQAIRAAAAHVATLNQRYHELHEVLRGAAAVDRDMADLWETAEQQRHTGAGHLVDRLAGHARLAVPRARAVDRLWLLMAPENYGRLVVARGWTPAAYRRWLREAIRSQLF